MNLSAAHCGSRTLWLRIYGCGDREMNKYDNARGARVTDALLNFETVKVFNNEELERVNLEDAIVKYQNVEYKLLATLNGLNILQSVIIFTGLIAGLVVCTKVCGTQGMLLRRLSHSLP
jgi:ABC-type transport system involved in Fe-S cluster assembly fused permease/ATPase subunit